MKQTYVHKSQFRDVGITAVDGTKPGGRRRPNDRTRGGHVVSYKLDADGNKVGAHIFKSTRTKTTRRTTPSAPVQQSYFARLAQLGATNTEY